MSQDTLRGYLVVNVKEGSGRVRSPTGDGPFTWDASGTFEAFVKVEIRGAAQNVKAQTRKAALVGETVNWAEQLQLELLDGSSELRIMLCREKYLGTKRGTSVIAACGIYVSDILEAVPIDKCFDLFKPNNGGEGGYIHVSMKFVKSLSEMAKPEVREQDRDALLPNANGGSEMSGADAGKGKRKGRRGLGLVVITLATAGAYVFALKKRQ